MNYIPTEVFAPVIESIPAIPRADPSRPGEKKHLDYEWMGALMDLNPDSLRGIFTKRSKMIDFNTADYILCKLNAQQLWYEKPLVDIYWDIPLTCARPGCDRDLKKRKKYCSRNCDYYMRHAGDSHSPD